MNIFLCIFKFIILIFYSYFSVDGTNTNKSKRKLIIDRVAKEDGLVFKI